MPKQKQGLSSSLFGMLIGLLMVVLLSPYLLWQANSQHRAKDFSSAQQIEAESNEEGYVAVMGNAVIDKKLNCPRLGDNLAIREDEPEEEFEEEVDNEDDEVVKALEDAGFEFEDVEDEDIPPADSTKEEEVTQEELRECFYVNESEETWSRAEEKTCGEVESKERIIRKLPEECDNEGNCEPCYIVEKFDWDQTDSDAQYAAFQLGSYRITPSGKAKFIGTESLLDYQYPEQASNPEEGDKRFDYTFMPANQSILVAGEASGQEIEGALDGKSFIISSKSYAGTLESLQDQDASSKMLLTVFSLLAMIIGMLLVVGPLTLLTDVFKFIPVLGKHADKGFDGVIKFAAVVFGLVLWGIVYGLVLIAKNIILIIVVLAVLGAGAYVLATKGKLKLKKGEQSE